MKNFLLQNWKTIIITFLIGSLAGVGVSRLFVGHCFRAMRSGKMEKNIARHVARKLKMTEDQKTETEKITAQAHADIRALLEENKPRMEKIFTDALDKIGALLDDTQKKEWETTKDHFLKNRLRMHKLMPWNNVKCPAEVKECCPAAK
ncbi:MAG: hypothetical protein A2096_09940 [Spirochaetes bacterium GWF1_41_5]|nr:MAG: hypothetical protein A2096_09940 [Spirochaetes bacterium GWF1_41_5]HBE03977.1 hypothetical protein [Spirochaetia bacterium]